MITVEGDFLNQNNLISTSSSKNHTHTRACTHTPTYTPFYHCEAIELLCGRASEYIQLPFLTKVHRTVIVKFMRVNEVPHRFNNT